MRRAAARTGPSSTTRPALSLSSPLHHLGAETMLMVALVAEPQPAAQCTAALAQCTAALAQCTAPSSWLALGTCGLGSRGTLRSGRRQHPAPAASSSRRQLFTPPASSPPEAQGLAPAPHTLPAWACLPSGLPAWACLPVLRAVAVEAGGCSLSLGAGRPRRSLLRLASRARQDPSLQGAAAAS